MKLGQEACKNLSKQDKCCVALLQIQEDERRPILSWWMIMLIVVASLAILIGSYIAIRYSMKNSSQNKNNSADIGRTDEEAEVIKDEEILVGILKKGNPSSDISPSTSKPGIAAISFKDERPFQTHIRKDSKHLVIKESKPTKSLPIKDSIPPKKSFFNRFQKNYPSLADDLEKAKAKGDQSINSLMKFFGAGSTDRNRPDGLDNLSELAAAFPPPPRVINSKSADPPVNSGNSAEKESTNTKQSTAEKEEITEKEPNMGKSSAVRTSSNIPIIFQASEIKTETGETVVVIETYEGKCADELSLVIGELIYIKKEFDDGWAVGIEQKSKKEGVFPIMCTAKLVTATNGKE